MKKILSLLSATVITACGTTNKTTKTKSIKTQSLTTNIENKKIFPNVNIVFEGGSYFIKDAPTEIKNKIDTLNQELDRIEKLVGGQYNIKIGALNPFVANILNSFGITQWGVAGPAHYLDEEFSTIVQSQNLKPYTCGDFTSIKWMAKGDKFNKYDKNSKIADKDGCYNENTKEFMSSITPIKAKPFGDMDGKKTFVLGTTRKINLEQLVKSEVNLLVTFNKYKNNKELASFKSKIVGVDGYLNDVFVLLSTIGKRYGSIAATNKIWHDYKVVFDLIKEKKKHKKLKAITVRPIGIQPGIPGYNSFVGSLFSAMGVDLISNQNGSWLTASKEAFTAVDADYVVVMAHGNRDTLIQTAKDTIGKQDYFIKNKAVAQGNILYTNDFVAMTTSAPKIMKELVTLFYE